MKTEPTRFYYGAKQWIVTLEKEGKDVGERVRKTLSE
jgi:hypothetical protein